MKGPVISSGIRQVEFLVQNAHNCKQRFSMNSLFASSFIYVFYIYVVVELVLGDTPCTGKTVPVPLSAVGSFCFYLKNNLLWETLFSSCVGPPQGPGNLRQRCS